MKFHPESPFFQFMNTLAAFIGLNAVFLITCLPVFTIGPALCALYTVTLREARGEGGYIISSYFKAFRRNFRKGTLTFLILLGLALVFLYNMVFWNRMGGICGTLLFLVTCLLMASAALTFLYAFPMIVCSRNTILKTLKAAFVTAVSNPGPTLGLLGILAVFIFFYIGFPDYAKVFMLIVGFSFLAYCNSRLLTRTALLHADASINATR